MRRSRGAQRGGGSPPAARLPETVTPTTRLLLLFPRRLPGKIERQLSAWRSSAGSHFLRPTASERLRLPVLLARLLSPATSSPEPVYRSPSLAGRTFPHAFLYRKPEDSASSAVSEEGGTAVFITKFTLAVSCGLPLPIPQACVCACPCTYVRARLQRVHTVGVPFFCLSSFPAFFGFPLSRSVAGLTAAAFFQDRSR